MVKKIGVKWGEEGVEKKKKKGRDVGNEIWMEKEEDVNTKGERRRVRSQPILNEVGEKIIKE